MNQWSLNITKPKLWRLGSMLTYVLIVRDHPVQRDRSTSACFKSANLYYSFAHRVDPMVRFVMPEQREGMEMQYKGTVDMLTWSRMKSKRLEWREVQVAWLLPKKWFVQHVRVMLGVDAVGVSRWFTNLSRSQNKGIWWMGTSISISIIRL